MVNVDKIITISIFGNRFVPRMEDARKDLYNYLKLKVKDNNVRILVGTHGDYDRLALGVCKQLQREYSNIHISLVFTSQKFLIKEMQMDEFTGYYKGVETMIYDIEEIYYKRQIVVSNQKMVDDSDEVVVYNRGNNSYYSGTNRVIKYAKKQNKPIINLFNEKVLNQ